MEEVLDRPIRRECLLRKNDRGGYDLQIFNENGRPAVNLKNITFRRAVSIIEDRMYQNGGTEHGS